MHMDNLCLHLSFSLLIHGVSLKWESQNTGLKCNPKVQCIRDPPYRYKFLTDLHTFY